MWEGNSGRVKRALLILDYCFSTQSNKHTYYSSRDLSSCLHLGNFLTGVNFFSLNDSAPSRSK